MHSKQTLQFSYMKSLLDLFQWLLTALGGILVSFWSVFRTYQSVGTSILQILKLRSAIPPTGMRSLPVAKWSSFFCSSRGKANTTSQKDLTGPRNSSLTWFPLHISPVFNFPLSSCAGERAELSCQS